MTRMVSEDWSLDGQGSASAAAKDPPLDHLPPKSPAAISSRNSTTSTCPATGVAFGTTTSHSPTSPLLSHEVPPVATCTSSSSSSSNTTTSSVTSATSATGSSETASLTSAAAAAAHASQLEQNGGTKTRDPDMSNHRLLPTGSSHVSVTYSSPAPPSASISMYSTVSPSAPGAISHGSLPPPLPHTSAPYHDGSYAPSTIAGRTSLPSMRTIDALAHQVPGMSNGSSSLHHTPSPTLTTTSISSSAGTARLYPTILSSNYGLPPDTMTRYANLPHNGHALLPRTAKKEIKRRTKTGCLTCRRRRIKCDENRPTCNNCKKSKRDCLGYDPIFRQQLRLVNTFSNTGPHHQQLAYSTSPLAEAPRALLPATPRSPIGLAPPYPSESRSASSPFSSHTATPNGIHHPHPVPPGLYTTPHSQRHDPPQSSHPSIPPTSASISRDSSLPASISPASSIRSPRVLPSATAAWDPSRPPASLQPHDSHQHSARVNKMRVDEIIDTLGPPPQGAQISHSEETFHEITKVYHEMYAGGLSAFFETTWYYFADNGKMSFPRDASLMENMGSFLKVLEGAQPHDHAYMAYSGALETRIVWQLAQTALRAASERTNNSMRVSLPPDGDPIEARNRIQVVQTLLSGEYLSSNPLTPPLQDHDAVRARQFDFWYHLGEFVREQPEPLSQSSVHARDDILSRLRHVLDGRENRDVLYSIAVVRELAPRFDPNYANTVPQHLDEQDPKNKLAVASRFILDEAQVTGGTTNVVRRICDIAARAFVNPGMNIARRG